MKRTIVWDSVALFLLASALIWPLFKLKYLDNWPSIESTFIADGRMLAENLPHPGWQPLWYCGTRFDYVYPPALRYGTALLSKIPRVVPARAYHLYTAVFYVLGIVAVYWLVLAGSGSRGGALLACAATALLSPSFLLMPAIRGDSGYWVPQRLHVLMTYGEGPHISGLGALTAAMAVMFLALRRWRPMAFAGACVLCGLAVTTNFYAATSMAIFMPLLTWAVWLGERDRSVWLRAVGIGVLAYGLCAFWLTPSYLRLTVVNLQWVAQPGNVWSRVAACAAVLVFCGVSFWFANRRPDRTWNVFVLGAALFFGLYVLGYGLGFRVSGDALRLIPELDLALILAAVQLVRWMWMYPKGRAAAVLVVMVAFSPSVRYLQNRRSPFPQAHDVETQYEYRITKWVHDHLDGERVLATGTVRFWYDAWFDNPDADGGSAQGMLNQTIPYATWEIERGDRADLAVLWLQALGTSAVIVPDRSSPEPYHDWAKPEKFRGVLPVLHDDGKGTVVYGVPRVDAGLGRVVDRARMASVGKNLAEYVAVVENPAQGKAAVSWRGTDEVYLEASVGPGQSVLLQETYDPAWRAYENGTPLAIHPDPFMGFMLIDVPEGNHSIRLRFETPFENRVGQAILFLTLAVLAVIVFPRRKRY